MIDQFVETWRINNRVNLMLLDAMNEDALHTTLSKKGGETPAKQFAHIHNVRFWKLEKLSPDLLDGLEKLSLKEGKDFSHEMLRYNLIKSSEAIAEVLCQGFTNGGEVKGFRRGVTTLQGYLISHEAHHRGNMMLTLNQSGYKLPKSLTYGIWDWNKI